MFLSFTNPAYNKIVDNENIRKHIRDLKNQIDLLEKSIQNDLDSCEEEEEQVVEINVLNTLDSGWTITWAEEAYKELPGIAASVHIEYQHYDGWYFYFVDDDLGGDGYDPVICEPQQYYDSVEECWKAANEYIVKIARKDFVVSFKVSWISLGDDSAAKDRLKEYLMDSDFPKMLEFQQISLQ